MKVAITTNMAIRVADVVATRARPCHMLSTTACDMPNLSHVGTMPSSAGSKRQLNNASPSWRRTRESSGIYDQTWFWSDKASIIDITIPFDNRMGAFEEARRAKEEKYAGLAETLHTRYSTVEVDTIVVGSLGSWDPASDRIMKRLCSKKYLALFRKLCVSDVARVSRTFMWSILQEHARLVTQDYSECHMATISHSTNLRARMYNPVQKEWADSWWLQT